jgi:hypothetical protein
LQIIAFREWFWKLAPAKKKRRMTLYGKNSSRLQDNASCRTVCSSYIIYDVTRECVANNERPIFHMFQNTHIGISIVVPSYMTKLRK